MRSLGVGATERWLIVVMLLMGVGLSLFTSTFLTLPNLFDLLNASSVNIIFGVGLLVVLIAGGIDISFAVAASVVQYLTALTLGWIGGGNWALGLILAGGFGAALGCFNAFWIYQFRIVSIVVTIATYNLFFGLLMFFSSGVSLYDLPDWLTTRIAIVSVDTANGRADLTILVVAMIACVAATWLLLRRTSTGRQLYAKRKTTIEPVYGQIKYNRGITHFMRRGRAAVQSEWRLVAATHNLLKLHSHWLANPA